MYNTIYHKSWGSWDKQMSRPPPFPHLPPLPRFIKVVTSTEHWIKKTTKSGYYCRRIYPLCFLLKITNKLKSYNCRSSGMMQRNVLNTSFFLVVSIFLPVLLGVRSVPSSHMRHCILTPPSYPWANYLPVSVQIVFWHERGVPKES